MEKIGEELGLAVDELERAERAFKAGDMDGFRLYLGTMWHRLVSVTVAPGLSDVIPPS